MPNFTFENQGTYSFLSYRLAPAEKVDSFALNMISNNNIPHVLPIAFSQTDGTTVLRYNITSKVTMQSFFNGVVQKKRLLGVLSSLAKAMLSAAEYMLDTAQFIIDDAFIFVDVSSAWAELVYLPVSGKTPEGRNLEEFVKEIMISSRFDQNEDNSYVAALLNHLNSTEMFSLKAFDELLEELRQGKPKMAQPPKEQIVQAPAQQAAATATPHVLQPAAPPQQAAGMPQQAMGTTPQPLVPQQAIGMTPQPLVPQQATGMPPSPQMSQAGVIPAKQKNGFFSGLFGGGKKQKQPKPAKKASGKGQRQAPSAPLAANMGFAIPGQEIPFGGASGNAAPPVPAAMQQKQPMQQQPIPQQAVPQNRAIPQPAVPQPASIPSQQPQPATVMGNFGETTILGSEFSSETTVLGASAPAAAAKQRVPVLIHEASGTIIPIAKTPFRIGKEKSYVDYFVANNPAISRSHADIVIEGQQCFLQDNNSLNHSYINGLMVEGNKKTPIKENDEIMLANEKYRFVFK